MQLNKVGEQKLYRLFGHFSLLFFLAGTLLSAASFEEFKKSQSESFTTYTEQKDKDFKSYLEQQWQEFNAQKAISLYEKPKPKNILSTFSKPLKNVGPKVSISLPSESMKKKDVNKQAKQKYIVVDLKPEAVKKDVNFNFYGTELGFNIDEKIKSATYYPQNQKGVGNFFDIVASSEYDYLVSAINEVSTKMHLNDWGVYQLVTKFSSEVFSSIDNRELFKWFLFNKLGYAVKVGLSNKHIVLMYYSQKVIYAAPSYTFADKKFYLLEQSSQNNSGSVYSYEQNYPDSDKALDLSLKELPLLALDTKSKTLSFKQLEQKYELTYHYNQNLIDFMATYPQADYDTFFNSPLDEKTYEEIAKGLKKHINGMQASTAINFVLNFVQNAFIYETDSEQFGYEKVMFAEETLYYAKSDCEDRAILFSNLVKNIFKISVIGVKYKDHMSTALYIPMEGDSVKSFGKRFVLADPTYINANIGQSMPKYKSKKPESFIIVKN